jgi:hypothetical protein
MSNVPKYGAIAKYKISFFFFFFLLPHSAGTLTLMLYRLGLDRGAIGKALTPDYDDTQENQSSSILVNSSGPTPSSSSNLVLDSPTSNHFVSR